MELDFSRQLNRKINGLGLFAQSKIGTLDNEDESISIMLMPGGTEKVYFDGERDKDQNVQINAKSMNQQYCMDALTKIYQHLENLEDLPSDNGSYEFQNIKTNSLPSFLLYDDQGFFVYEMSIVAKITIYEGVVMNG